MAVGRVQAIRFGNAGLSLLAALCAIIAGVAAAGEPPQATTAETLAKEQSSGDEELMLGVNWTVDRFERVETFHGDVPFRIINPFGDLRLRAADGDELRVVGAGQYSTTDAVRPVVDIRETEGEVTVEVRFPNLEEGKPDLEPAEVGKRRVDLAVILPGAGGVQVESLDGLVDARGLPGHLSVHSRSGLLRIVARSSLDLYSQHGNVEVFFKGVEALPDLAVETVTGDIRVELPAGVDRTIRAETNGLLATDFSVTIDKAAGSPHKVALATLGDGGDVIHLTSNLGMISILGQPLLVEPVSP